MQRGIYRKIMVLNASECRFQKEYGCGKKYIKPQNRRKARRILKRGEREQD